MTWLDLTLTSTSKSASNNLPQLTLGATSPRLMASPLPRWALFIPLYLGMSIYLRPAALIERLNLPDLNVSRMGIDPKQLNRI